MFDHLSIGVRELARSVAFYDAVLGALGQVRLGGSARAATWGPPGFTGEAPFAVIATEHAAPGAAVHLAFAAREPSAVDAFHAAALAHGGRCDGPPGIRLHYDPGYYAAFVLDPDGHRLEAVVHLPVSAPAATDPHPP